MGDTQGRVVTAVCANGSHPAATVTCYLVPGLREAKPLCADCVARLAPLYGELTEDRRAVDRRAADRRRLRVAPVIRRAG